MVWKTGKDCLFMNLRYMDRDTTAAIKGIALIFMFIHHFYNFPDFYIEGISFPWVESFTNLTYALLKMCVALFAFLTGYFYAFNSQRTWRYSFRKISDLYVCYWLVYLPMLLFAVLTGCYEFSLYSFAFELAGLKLPFMVFCWYIEFYCCTMLLLQLLAHRENNPVEDILWLLILPAAWLAVALQYRIRRRFRRADSPNALALSLWQDVEGLCRVTGTTPPEMLEELANRAKYSRHTLSERELEAFTQWLARERGSLPLHRRFFCRYFRALW